MLQSFIGTMDAQGIRSFRREEQALRPTGCLNNGVGFWAVLDSAELPRIQAALMQGDRETALELLARRARDFGRLAL